MDEKISLSAIDQYSKRYSSKLLKDFFSGKDHINGKEILSLCPIEQVNYFVLGILFAEWRGEERKLRSKYFDYENQEVKGALENLMRLLSNNISISRSDFTPLLEKAVSRTLLTVLAPYDFYSSLIEGERNELNVETFGGALRYIRINKPPLQKLYERLLEKKKETIPGSEAFALLDQILEEVNFTPEDVEGYIEKFASLEPFSIESFYEEVKPIKKVSEGPPTINDKLSQPRTTLADDFQKILSIKEHLTINQKFMFTKVLFDGDFESFSKVIEKLDQLDSYKAAMKYLSPYTQKWESGTEELEEFLEMVEKRFSA